MGNVKREICKWLDGCSLLSIMLLIFKWKVASHAAFNICQIIKYIETYVVSYCSLSTIYWAVDSQAVNWHQDEEIVKINLMWN